MQGFCERFLRFVAGEIADPDECRDCFCRDQGFRAEQITVVESKASAIEADLRLEPFRPTIRITAS